ncbi:hypothetical protein R3W88_002882 [Solanum pinnatisectum]|uniref:Uncharacterized protein n=1 Tax=Solanum pinnatisectum TaxID=50273 RepID=A0AAV9MQ68_9SOLN|nr:hypothetical protein R3W88_002882 [Solanum pinnatisectum]
MHRQSTIQIDIQTPPSPPLSAPPPPLPAPPGCRRGKVLAGASNLVNLLPTGTVLTFQTLIPSFTDGGSCLITHKYLTLGLIIICAAACFFSSFTDSFIDQNGKIQYGISKDALKEYLRSYSLKRMGFIRALVSLMVFLTFAIGDANVQDCYCPKSNPNMEALFMNLPLDGALFSLLFFLLLVGELAMPIHLENLPTMCMPLLPKTNTNPTKEKKDANSTNI